MFNKIETIYSATYRHMFLKGVIQSSELLFAHFCGVVKILKN